MIAVVSGLAVAALVVVLLPGGAPGHARGWRSRLSRLARPRIRSAASRRAADLEWVEALVGETRAGRDPASAVAAASRSVPGDRFGRVAAAATGGGDVVAALRATTDASDLLLGVAACWEVAHGSGAGLAASLTALADAARESERVRRDLRTGLAEPRATAVVLAALPLLGLVLGGALGADPMGWLLGTPVGLLVLAVGLVLEAAGVLWSWRIVRGLEAEL